MARSGGAFERDRFDDVPVDLARVGAHRAPDRRARGVVVFAWAALATGVLVGAGVLGLGAIEKGVTGDGATTTASTSQSAAAAPAATVDPKASVLVLNGTTTSGLASKASATAKGDGWNVVSATNAASQDFKISTVYYATDGQRGAALGLAKSLGIGRTQKSDQFAVEGRSRLAVVLGADFAGA